MLTITVIISLALIWSNVIDIQHYDQIAETSEERSNYFIAKIFFFLMLMAVIWGGYAGRMQAQDELENYKKGTLQYEPVKETVYRLKTK